MLVGQVHSENQKEVKKQNGKCQKNVCRNKTTKTMRVKRYQSQPTKD